jgi:2,5-diketo-D-gluconate reductase A
MNIDGDQATNLNRDSRLQLVNGAQIPVVGLGTYPMSNDSAAKEVATALELGYRLVDTAFAYGNEAGVGKGIRDSGVAREDVFLTTKFNRESHSREGVRLAWERSVKLLDVDYLDLLLIHWPNPGYGKFVEAWEGMIELLEQGRVLAIGLSNFKIPHSEQIIATGVMPDVNQIQLSPFYPRHDVVEFHRAHGIVTEGWSPLKPVSMLESDAITSAAAAHNVTPAQVALRWQIQQGIVPIPKSSHPDRQRANLDVFGFELDHAEMMAIDALARDESEIADSDVTGH